MNGAATIAKPEMADGHDWTDRPIFVTGLMKTGSTLLLALFDGHPELLVYPDEPSFDRLFSRRHENAAHRVKDWLFGTPNPLHYNALIQDELLAPLGFSPKSWDPLPADAPVDHIDLDALRKRLKLRGVDRDRSRAAVDLESYHEHLWSALSAITDPSARDVVVATARAFAACVSGDVHPRRWLFKHPVPRHRASSLEWFFREFPEGNVIVLMRDPRGYLNSHIHYARARRPSTPPLWRPLFVLRRLKDLEADYQAFTQLAESQPTSISLAYYERIVGDTAAAMRELCERVGLSAHEAATRPSKAGEVVEVPTATTTSGRDVYRGSTDKWRRELRWAERLLTEVALSDYLERADVPYEAETPRAIRRALRPFLRAALSVIPTGRKPESPL